MKPDLLKAMLGKVAKKSGDSFVFGAEATLMVAAGGTMLPVERVIKATWDEAGFLDLVTSRDERYLIDVETVCGIGVGKKTSSDGAGFTVREP